MGKMKNNIKGDLYGKGLRYARTIVRREGGGNGPL